MRTFHLEPGMTTIRGVFYPTGYMVLMFPSEQGARDAAQLLHDQGVGDDDVSLMTPEIIQEEVTRTVGSADIPLPSAGTEGDTVRRFAEYASKGHFGLMVHPTKEHDADRIMDILKDCEISYGQRYRRLVIEDVA